MKKILYPLLLALPLLAATSCNDNKEDARIDFVFNQYNHIYDTSNGDVAMTTGVLNFHFVLASQATVTLSQAVGMDGLTQPYNYVLPETNAPFNQSANAYLYKYPQPISAGASTLTNFVGAYDAQTGLNYVTYLVDGQFRVTSTATLAYSYTHTIVHNNGNKTIDTNNMSYQVLLDNTKQKAKLVMFKYQLIPEGNPLDEVIFEGLDYVVTPEGYHVTGTNIEASSASLDEVDVTIDKNCQALSGTLKSGTHTATLSGTMFLKIIEY